MTVTTLQCQEVVVNASTSSPTSPGSHAAQVSSEAEPIPYCVVHKLVDSYYGPIFIAQRTDLMSPSSVSSISFPERVVVKQMSLNRAREAIENCPAADNPWEELRAIEILMSQPAHENVLQFHQVVLDEDAQEMEVVMEYCQKGDLCSWILKHQEEFQRLDEKDALCKFVEIAQGLQFLHQNNIAHRDLSLENVLLSDDEKCRVCDFGLSTCASRRCHDRVGKPFYTALEVAHCADNTKGYDPVKADIWSLGIMLFMMLTGSPLWDVDDVSLQVIECVACHGASWVIRSWGKHSLMFATMDLLDRILRVKPCERMTLDEILQHPVVVWIQRQPAWCQAASAA